MLNARLIDFCFHLHPDWTFGAIAKFASELFKIRNLFKENLVIEEIIGLVDGPPIRLKRVGGESAIAYTLEHNGVVWLINDNVAGIPNQDYSRKLIEYMERDFENETLVDIFGLQDQSVIPTSIELYKVWIFLVDAMKNTQNRIEQETIHFGKDKKISLFNVRRGNDPAQIVGKMTYVASDIYKSFLLSPKVPIWDPKTQLPVMPTK